MAYKAEWDNTPLSDLVWICKDRCIEVKEGDDAPALRIKLGKKVKPEKPK